MNTVKYLSAAALSTLAAAGNNSCCHPEPEAPKPNIVVILADDMGYGDVSWLDHNSKINTVNIDRMAGEGVVFTDAHSPSSVSTPTRYGLLTGRYNWRSTLKSGVLGGYSKALIAADRPTVATMLRNVGYTTACIGKWHLGWDWHRTGEGGDAMAPTDLSTVDRSVDYSQAVDNGPSTRGFDYSYCFCGSLDMPPYVYVENDMPTAMPDHTTVNKGRYSWWREGPTAPDFVHEEVLTNITDRACDYIVDRAKSDTPYFLYLPLPAPHTPILPSAEFRGKSGLGDYGDFVLMVDAMVGRVLQAVKESGEDDNTIVVFTTDNGCSPAAGIDTLIAQGHHPSSIYRGHKADLFDGGHRIPCILRWPARTAHHTVSQTVCLTDLYATFAAIGGYRVPDNQAEDSYNILPAIVAQTEIAPIREATVHHSIEGQFTIRKGEWKLLLSPSSGGWSYPQPSLPDSVLSALPPVQLYNMSTDPAEQHNLEAQYPDKVAELRNLLIKYIREGRSTPGKPQSNDGTYPWQELDWIEE